MEQLTENNHVIIGGVVGSKLEESHELFGEKFYKFYIETERLSSTVDRLPVIISERLIDVEKFDIGTEICIEGQYRSYNQMQEDGKSKLILTTFARSIEFEGFDERNKLKNELTLFGNICKPPIYRRTPLGRDIADVLIAVNRSYNKSDYIPCILWGRTAKFCKTLTVGTNVKIVGRVQAREYEKKIDGEVIEKRVAYEVSVSKFEEYRPDEEKISNVQYMEENIEE